jgi:hypothetical protein
MARNGDLGSNVPITERILAIRERWHTKRHPFWGVHEKVFAATIAHDETKPLGRVVPLHRAVLLDRGSVGRLICSSLRPLTPGLFLRRRAGVHAQDLRLLRSLRSGAGAHLKRRAGEHTALSR